MRLVIEVEYSETLDNWLGKSGESLLQFISAHCKSIDKEIIVIDVTQEYNQACYRAGLAG